MSRNLAILRLARTRGIFRPRDLPAGPNTGRVIRQLVEEGSLVRLGRGLYAHADYQPSCHHSLVAACTAIPRGIVCLLSALDFHGFTVQQPYHHWIAVDHNGPVASHGLPLRIIRMSGAPFVEGAEEHHPDGNLIRVYSPAKTIVDCFRYRNKIGIDVAIESLQEGWRLRKFAMADLDHYARVCRVTNVMKPYKEMLLA